MKLYNLKQNQKLYKIKLMKAAVNEATKKQSKPASSGTSLFLILNGNIRWLIIVTGAVYLLGVQGITIFIHLPLNDRIQSVKVDEVDDETVHQQRLIFEARWNFFNRVRTAFGFCATAMFLFAISTI